MFGAPPRKAKNHPKARFTTLRTLIDRNKPRPIAKTIVYGIAILLLIVVITIFLYSIFKV